MAAALYGDDTRAGSAHAMARSWVGGGQNTVMRSVRSQATRSGPSRAASSSMTTTVAPAANASHVSSTDES